MDAKKILGILLISILFFSTINAAAVTDTTTTSTSGVTVTDLTNQTANITQQQTQSFAQINARLAELTSQVQALQTQISTNQEQTFKKSDVQNLYENIVNICHLSEMSIIMDILVIVLLAFAAFFILVGKNMLPQREKKPKKVNPSG